MKNSHPFPTLGLTILCSGMMSTLVFADNFPPKVASPNYSLCNLVHTLQWTAKTPNTDWKLNYLPITFPVPLGLQTRCLLNSAEPASRDCLVLQSAGYTFWTYHDPNSVGTVLIAHDPLGNLGQRWEMRGLYLVDIQINPLADTVDFIGNNGAVFSLTWSELTLEPAVSPAPPPPEIPKVAQTITVELPAQTTVGTSLSLTARGGASENSVTLESATPYICAVNGSQLTTLRAGTCTVVARQAGNDHYLAATPLEKTIVIKPPTPISTAPSQLCFSVTGTSTAAGVTKVGYCNDYRFNSGVPCLSVTTNSEVVAGTCDINELSPRPYPMKTLEATGYAEIGNNYSATTPRCDSSAEFSANHAKLPNTFTFACVRYQRNAAANSFYYGIAMFSNSQILSYKLETTADRCVGNCPTAQ